MLAGNIIAANMLSLTFQTVLSVILAVNLCLSVAQKPSQDPSQDVDTIKIDTDLVTVPVIATDRNGAYVADLRQEEFALTEDGVAQQIAFFGKISLPFHVVLIDRKSTRLNSSHGYISYAG